MKHEREMMAAPPYGLCACRLGSEYVHIAAISPRCVVVRLPKGKLPAGSVTLQLYRPEEGRYETHTITKYQAGEAQRQQDAVLFRLCFDDPACAGSIRRCMNIYARYLETKSTLGASAWAKMISGYPAAADEVFCASLPDQRKAWFSSFPALPEPGRHISLAVELNCPELWNLYLSLPLDAFMRAYAQGRQLPDGLLPHRLPNRLYIGSSFCRLLFPDMETLQALCRKAEKEGLHITLATSSMPAGSESAANAIISFAQRHGAELMVNDWGFLQRTAGKCSLLLGPLLNRRRKDPRFAYKPGLNAALLGQNSLHNQAWREYLSKLGVEGYAWESGAGPIDLPPGTNCLHLPFYQTNTSLWCPLQALCLRGDRASQQPSELCAFPCENNALLYPGHLKMIGRWNSIFALDDAPDPAFMHRFDRWVLNF